MRRTEETLRTEKVWAAVSALITFIAFQMKYDEVSTTGNVYWDTVSNLFQSFPEFHISSVALLVLLYLFYKTVRSGEHIIDRKWTVVLPAFLFAMFMIWGYSFERTGGWYLVRHFRNGQIMKTIVIGAGYYLFFYWCIAGLYQYLDHISEKRKASELQEDMRSDFFKNPVKCYVNFLTVCPFRTSLVTLFILYIPYVIIFYPTIFQGDTYSQIVQGYKELGTSGIYYMTNDHLLAQDVFINQHHPVLHTLLIHACLVVGTGIFQSLNVGIFMYSVFQWIICIIVISYGVKILVKELKVSAKYAFLVILYFTISPRIQNYMFLVTKDVLYGMCFILVMTALFGILKNEDEPGMHRDYIILASASAGMILFRNEAVYVLVVSLLVIACLCQRSRNVMIFYVAGVLVFSVLIFKVLFPILSFTPGSVREMLAVPFQQTARYVRDFGEEVTEEEVQAISSILDYPRLAEKYDPNNVDNVKATYNENATEEELKRYFKVWFKMGLKHPSVYIQATLNNYYRYFYPGAIVLSSNSSAWSEECMELTNGTIAPLGMQFSYPEHMKEIRTGYEYLRDSLDKVPLFNILVNPAVYVWIIMIIFFYGIRKKNVKVLALVTIPSFTILMRLLGPCNGQYCRYMYPIMVIMPFMVPMALFQEKR